MCHRIMFGIALSAMAAAAGCESSSSGSDVHKDPAYQKQESALGDPMHYSPFDKKADMTDKDGSHLQRPDIGKDLKNVFDP